MVYCWDISLKENCIESSNKNKYATPTLLLNERTSTSGAMIICVFADKCLQLQSNRFSASRSLENVSYVLGPTLGDIIGKNTC